MPHMRRGHTHVAPLILDAKVGGGGAHSHTYTFINPHESGLKLWSPSQHSSLCSPGPDLELLGLRGVQAEVCGRRGRVK